MGSLLGCLAGAYRSCPNESTCLTPNMMCLGREVRLPADLIYGLRQPNEFLSETAHVELIRERMIRAHEVARRYLKANAKRSKEIYDTKVAYANYSPGDLVWMLHEGRKVGVTPKLEKKFDGPFVITRRRSPITFVVQIDAGGRDVLVHHDKIKQYNGCNVPTWACKISKRLMSSL